MTIYFEVTATMEGFDDILFGSYELREAKEELYITKPDLKREGYKNIRIEKRVEKWLYSIINLKKN